MLPLLHRNSLYDARITLIHDIIKWNIIIHFLLETFFKNNPSFCSFSSPNQELIMRSWFVSCFVLSMVVFLQVCQARLRGPSGRIGLPGPKGVAPVKYCAISTKITTFLKQFRSVGLKGASGGGLRGRMVSYDVTCILLTCTYSTKVENLLQCWLKQDWTMFCRQHCSYLSTKLFCIISLLHLCDMWTYRVYKKSAIQIWWFISQTKRTSTPPF